MIRPLFAAVLAEQLYLVRLYFAALWRRKKNNEDYRGIAAIVTATLLPTRKCAVFPARERCCGSNAGPELEKKIQEARSLALKDLIDRQLIVQSFHKEKFELPSISGQTISRHYPERFRR